MLLLNCIRRTTRKLKLDMGRGGEENMAPYFYMLSEQYFVSSYLLSEDKPAVAIKDDELMKTKSLAVLLWHCQV